MKELEEISKLYKLTNTSIKALNIRSVNKTFRIDSNQGVFFLKQIYKLRGFDPKEILGQIDIANHLSKKGVKTFVPLKNSKGKQLSKVGDEYFLLYNFIKIDDHNKFTEEHFELAAIKLAEFHEAMKDFKIQNPMKENPLQDDIDTITNFTETKFSFSSESVISIAKKSKSKFSKIVLKDAPMIKEAIIRAIHHTWNRLESEETILHYDFGPHNVFFSDGEFVAISDFDFSHKGYIETDVAKAARFWAKEDDNTVNLVKFKRFIYLYNKERKIKMDWDYYYGLLIMMVLRRLVYAANYTVSNKKDLSFLYEIDIKTVEFLMKNKL